MDVNATGLNANASNATFVGPVFPAYIRPVATILCSLVMGIGVLGNIMVLLVIFKSKDMRSSTNIFLMNLSVADLMVLLVCTPTVLVEVNSKPETWVLGEEMCKAVPFIETTVSHASVLTILAISFERYYAICEPLKAGYVCTKARACFICVCAWAVAAVLTSPILLIPEYGLKEHIDGTMVMACLVPVNSVWRKVFFYVSISLFFWVPFLILLILYSVIAIRLMADPGIKGNETFNHRARRQLVLMLGTVVLLFFLCLMPFRVFLLWYIDAPGAALQALGVERYFNILYFCRIMFYVNSAVNPILYNLMSSKFRDGFLRLCSMRSEQYFLRRRSPIVLFTTFGYIRNFDNSIDPVCITTAESVWAEVFFLSSIFIFFMLPLFILVILYYVIASNLMTTPGIVPVTRQDSTTASLRYRKQVVLMIFTVVVFFFMCMLPFRALVVYIIVAPHEHVSDTLGNEGYFPLLYFCRLMFYTNSAVNPILYNLMSTKFRSGFLKLCGLKKNCLRKHTRALLRNSTFNTSTITALTTTSTSSHRTSFLESISRSKTNSISKQSLRSSRQESLRVLTTKEITPITCHIRLNVVNTRRRRMSVSDCEKRPDKKCGVNRSKSADSFFRTESVVEKIIPVKASIRFVENNDSISVTMLNNNCTSAIGDSHSILKTHSRLKKNCSVLKKQISDGCVPYNYHLIPSCAYLLSKKDLKESFV